MAHNGQSNCRLCLNNLASVTSAGVNLLQRPEIGALIEELYALKVVSSDPFSKCICSICYRDAIQVKKYLGLQKHKRRIVRLNQDFLKSQVEAFIHEVEPAKSPRKPPPPPSIKRSATMPPIQQRPLQLLQSEPVAHARLPTVANNVTAQPDVWVSGLLKDVRTVTQDCLKVPGYFDALFPITVSIDASAVTQLQFLCDNCYRVFTDVESLQSHQVRRCKPRCRYCNALCTKQKPDMHMCSRRKELEHILPGIFPPQVEPQQLPPNQLDHSGDLAPRHSISYGDANCNDVMEPGDGDIPSQDDRMDAEPTVTHLCESVYGTDEHSDMTNDSTVMNNTGEGSNVEYDEHQHGGGPNGSKTTDGDSSVGHNATEPMAVDEDEISKTQTQPPAEEGLTPAPQPCPPPMLIPSVPVPNAVPAKSILKKPIRRSMSQAEFLEIVRKHKPIRSDGTSTGVYYVRAKINGMHKVICVKEDEKKELKILSADPWNSQSDNVQFCTNGTGHLAIESGESKSQILVRRKSIERNSVVKRSKAAESSVGQLKISHVESLVPTTETLPPVTLVPVEQSGTSNSPVTDSSGYNPSETSVDASIDASPANGETVVGQHKYVAAYRNQSRSASMPASFGPETDELDNSMIERNGNGYHGLQSPQEVAPETPLSSPILKSVHLPIPTESQIVNEIDGHNGN